MGQAKRRGTFEQRKEEAIAAGRDRKPPTRGEQKRLARKVMNETPLARFFNKLNDLVEIKGR